MADEPENLTLVYLRRMDGKIDHLMDEVAEIKLRQTDIARSVGSIRRDQGSDAENAAHIQAQLDRLKGEMDRIKRRLDINDG